MRLKETKHYERWVKKAYAADSECIEKWHITAGWGYEYCVRQTVYDLTNAPDLTFYTIFEGKEFVGYFGSEFDGIYMTTIFVMPKYRNRKPEIWALIKSKMKKNFKGGLYTKNLPAVGFYSKMGKKIGTTLAPLGEVVVFEFGGSSCQ